jgi:hypothetical protein
MFNFILSLFSLLFIILLNQQAVVDLYKHDLTIASHDIHLNLPVQLQLNRNIKGPIILENTAKNYLIEFHNEFYQAKLGQYEVQKNLQTKNEVPFAYYEANQADLQVQIGCDEQAVCVYPGIPLTLYFLVCNGEPIPWSIQEVCETIEID